MTLPVRFVITFLDALLAARAEDQDLSLLASIVLHGARLAFRHPDEAVAHQVCQGTGLSGAKLGSTVKGLELRTVESGFGVVLRRHRLAAGLSQEALAERARMSSNGVSALERGYRRTPQRQTLALLADALSLNGNERALFESIARHARRTTTALDRNLPREKAGENSLLFGEAR